MALYFLETSAFVKLYVREPGTDVMVALASRAQGHRLAILTLSRVEFRAAIRRRERLGDLDGAAANALIQRMDHHLETLFLVQPLSEAVTEQAGVLIDAYPLRAFDSFQLAGCVILRNSVQGSPPVFVCSDQQLLSAAQKEGFVIFDPAREDHSP